jgi:enterochelin esterase-like enzyme
VVQFEFKLTYEKAFGMAESEGRNTPASNPAPADPVSDEEDKAEREVARRSAVELPALYCDAFWTTSWTGHVRIAFGEYLDQPRYRTAIVMPLDEAEALANYILRLVEREKRASDKDKPES